MKISAAAFGAFGVELRGAACDSRDWSFQRIATSTLIMDCDTSEFLTTRGLKTSFTVVSALVVL